MYSSISILLKFRKAVYVKIGADFFPSNHSISYTMVYLQKIYTRTHGNSLLSLCMIKRFHNQKKEKKANKF